MRGLNDNEYQVLSILCTPATEDDRVPSDEEVVILNALTDRGLANHTTDVDEHGGTEHWTANERSHLALRIEQCFRRSSFG